MNNNQLRNVNYINKVINDEIKNINETIKVLKPKTIYELNCMLVELFGLVAIGEPTEKELKQMRKSSEMTCFSNNKICLKKYSYVNNRLVALNSKEFPVIIEVNINSTNTDKNFQNYMDFEVSNAYIDIKTVDFNIINRVKLYEDCIENIELFKNDDLIDEKFYITYEDYDLNFSFERHLKRNLCSKKYWNGDSND